MSKDKKNNPLNENTIRRFMKLAEIDGLSNQFVDTLSEKYSQDEENIEEMGRPAPYGRDDELAMAMDRDDAVEDEAPAAEEGAERSLDVDEEDLEAFLRVAEQVRAALGVPPEGLEGELEEPPMEDDPLEDDPLADEPLEEEDGEPFEVDAPLEEEEETQLDEEVVNEIARRIALRLEKEAQRENVSEELAERILNRIKEQKS